MRNYDEIIGKLMRSAVQMEKFVVEQGEPLYVRDGVREILRRITKLDEYMSYGADSDMYRELVDEVANDVYCTRGSKHDYKVISTDGTLECKKCGLRNSQTEEIRESVIFNLDALLDGVITYDDFVQAIDEEICR